MPSFVKNHETISISEDTLAFAESDNISFSCDDKRSCMSFAAKASVLGHLAVPMQTLVSTTVLNEAFILSEFLVQGLKLSNRTRKLASDLYTEAQEILT